MSFALNRERSSATLGWTLAVVLGFALMAAGCASKKSEELPAPGTGIAEYQTIVKDARRAIREALDSLSAVSSQSNQCSPEAISRLSAEVNELQVESIQVRARTQAIQARGDKYFENWQETMARVKDPRVRALAEAKRPALQESFQRIKSISQDTRKVFQPFLSGMRTLRNALEKDPAAINRAEERKVLETALENGREVDRCLAGIGHELDSMRVQLTPAENPNEK